MNRVKNICKEYYPYFTLIGVCVVCVYFAVTHPRVERQLNKTEYAAYNYCNMQFDGRCRIQSVSCHPSIDNKEIDACNVSYTIQIHNGANFGSIAMKCKNLVCEAKN